MRRAAGFLAVAVLGLLAGSLTASGQQTTPMKKAAAAPTIASVMQTQLGIVEHEFVGAAEAMPEDKYSFAPTNGEYKGVRTFAQEVKHVATVNFAFYSAILGQAPPPGVSANEQLNGPDDIQTKEQIVNYLKDSFALGHKAFATLTMRNAVTPLAKTPLSFLNTRLAAGELWVHARVRPLRTNGGVFADERNRSASEPGAAAGESGEEIIGGNSLATAPCA
ncbi:MAG: DinB family protein [Candidatus Acidiferrales bacterium]